MCRHLESTSCQQRVTTSCDNIVCLLVCRHRGKRRVPTSCAIESSGSAKTDGKYVCVNVHTSSCNPVSHGNKSGGRAQTGGKYMSCIHRVWRPERGDRVLTKLDVGQHVRMSTLKCVARCRRATHYHASMIQVLVNTCVCRRSDVLHAAGVQHGLCCTLSARNTGCVLVRHR